MDGYDAQGNRVYDKVEGQTCHQCRQKTMGKRTSCSQCQSLSVCPRPRLLLCFLDHFAPLHASGLVMILASCIHLPWSAPCNKAVWPASNPTPRGCGAGGVLRRLPVHAVRRERGRGERKARLDVPALPRRAAVQLQPAPHPPRLGPDRRPVPQGHRHGCACKLGPDSRPLIHAATRTAAFFAVVLTHCMPHVLFRSDGRHQCNQHGQ